MPLNLARRRKKRLSFRKLYAKRAGIEGTVAQAVRTCVTCGRRATLEAKSFGFRYISYGYCHECPSVLSSGSQARNLLQHLFLVLPSLVSFLPNFWPRPN